MLKDLKKPKLGSYDIVFGIKNVQYVTNKQ